MKWSGVTYKWPILTRTKSASACNRYAGRFWCVQMYSNVNIFWKFWCVLFWNHAKALRQARPCFKFFLVLQCSRNEDIFRVRTWLVLSIVEKTRVFCRLQRRNALQLNNVYVSTRKYDWEVKESNKKWIENCFWGKYKKIAQKDVHVLAQNCWLYTERPDAATPYFYRTDIRTPFTFAAAELALVHYAIWKIIYSC